MSDAEIQKSEKVKTEKEKLFEYIEKPNTTSARNLMGCNENWYNKYYAIKETFTVDELKSMTDSEIDHLVTLADSISEALW